MVASLRCNELKEEALARVEGMIERLRQRCENERVDNFGEECRRIVIHAAAHYDEYGKHYEKGVYEKIRRELIHLTLLQQSLFLCFDS